MRLDRNAYTQKNHMIYSFLIRPRDEETNITGDDPITSYFDSKDKKKQELTEWSEGKGSGQADHVFIHFG